MTTNFSILSAITAPSNYSWDYGVPFSTNSALVCSLAVRSTNLVTGYSPGLSVVFSNTSTDDTDYQYTEYTWNFGDYYHTTNNNLSLSCTRNVSHLYVMPGTYIVTLKHTQSKNSSFLYGSINPVLSGYNKYCKFWNWYDLGEIGTNPVTWESTKTAAIYAKKWTYEAITTQCQNNNFTLSALNVDIIQSQGSTPITVQVLEVLPQARMSSVTRSVTGFAPLRLQITARTSIPGSFPIDRIDWSFGDNTSIKTVSRYFEPDSTLFTFTCAISNDLLDPRNYDATYTYNRQLDTYPIFYPSITAYSSSTGSYDTCSLTVGPIALSSISGKTQILKTKKTENGRLYCMQVNNNLTFVTDLTTANTITQNIPPNIIKNSYSSRINYFGNRGTSYLPVTSTFTC